MAARVAEQLLAAHHPYMQECTLIPSTGGVFEVYVGEDLIFSKKALGQFPEEGEVVQLFEAKYL